MFPLSSDPRGPLPSGVTQDHFLLPASFSVVLSLICNAVGFLHHCVMSHLAFTPRPGGLYLPGVLVCEASLWLGLHILSPLEKCRPVSFPSTSPPSPCRQLVLSLLSYSFRIFFLHK